MNGAPRGFPARIGIVALNFLSPGLGLLRVQRPKAAVIFLLAPTAMTALVILVYTTAPTLGFLGWTGFMAFFLTAIAVIVIAPMVMSWRSSKLAQPTLPWWSRWYGIAGALLLVTALRALQPFAARDHYRTYFTLGASMAPTLVVNDRLVASMHGPGALRRGDLIMFDLEGISFLRRVAALPGDRIALRGGVVVLNGRSAPQRLLRTERVEEGPEARRLAERFPGEAAAHEIYDMEQSAADDMAEQRVSPGHVFVLGDNRDRSLDSRDLDVGPVPISDIRGRPLFRTWGPGGRIGEPLNR